MQSAKNNVITLYKPPGVTPLELIRRFIDLNPEYKGVKLGYAGRLDPMAEGVQLVLVGDENKKRKDYEFLSKTYESDIVFGISTDTYDGMGIIKEVFPRHPAVERVTNILSSLSGTFDHPYPPYSSPIVNGKPLYYWAREGKIHMVKIPVKKITVESIDIIEVKTMTMKEIAEDIISRVKIINGEFRQEDIIEQWDLLARSSVESFLCVSTRFTCSSGTYIRSLAHLAGQKAGTGAFALHIKRTRVGTYTLDKAIHLDH